MSDRENSTGEKADNTLHDRIKLRAYELYQSRGSVDGSDLQDWLKLSGRYLELLTKPIGKQLISSTWTRIRLAHFDQH
jgi:hypothetical protein